MAPGAPLGGPWGALGAQGGSNGRKRTPKGRLPGPFGLPFEVQMSPFWIKNGAKMNPKKEGKNRGEKGGSGLHFGLFWEPFW